MSKQSEAVISWRKRTKARIVDAMGGKCYVCGYARCHAAFDLHHLDPTEKEFGLGGMRANPIAWARIVEELRKCILVCATCHREIEDGFVNVDGARSTFNETFVDYTIGVFPRSRNTQKVNCKQCEAPLAVYSKRQKFCSDVCKRIHTYTESERKSRQAQRPRKTVWPEKAVLESLLETESWCAIGRKYRVSDNAVRKWARSYGLI